MLGKIEGKRRREQQSMQWLDNLSLSSAYYTSPPTYSKSPVGYCNLGGGRVSMPRMEKGN